MMIFIIFLVSNVMVKIKYSEVKVGDKIEYNKKILEVIKVESRTNINDTIIRIDFKDGTVIMGKSHVELKLI